MIEFVTASHNYQELNNNLLRSNVFPRKQLIVQGDYANVSKAYNDIKRTICYVHHDVFLPEQFYMQVQKGISYITSIDPNWGVIGVAGVKLINGKKENFGNILDRGKKWAYNLDKLPAEVDTLDELLLITKGDFTFDENLPLDYYGADICMQAKQQGRKCYAINAYVEHNSTREFGARTESFYKSQEYFKNKWKEFLPVVTTCSLLTND